MTQQRICHLPVTDPARLVGIGSIGDVVTLPRDRYQEELDTVQIRIPGDQPARKR